MLERAETYAGTLAVCPACNGAMVVGGRGKARARRLLHDGVRVAKAAGDAPEVARLTAIGALVDEQAVDDSGASSVCLPCGGTGHVTEGERVVCGPEGPKLDRHASWFGATARCSTCRGVGCSLCEGHGYLSLDPVGHSFAVADEGKRQPDLLTDHDMRRMELVTSLLRAVGRIDEPTVWKLELYFGDIGCAFARDCKRGRDVVFYPMTDPGVALLSANTDGTNQLSALARMRVLVLLDEKQRTNRAQLDACADQARGIVLRMGDVWEEARKCRT
jgi:hypothetical protein